jgi:hypothetical protein
VLEERAGELKNVHDTCAKVETRKFSENLEEANFLGLGVVGHIHLKRKRRIISVDICVGHLRVS